MLATTYEAQMVRSHVQELWVSVVGGEKHKESQDVLFIKQMIDLESQEESAGHAHKTVLREGLEEHHYTQTS